MPLFSFLFPSQQEKYIQEKIQENKIDELVNQYLECKEKMREPQDPGYKYCRQFVEIFLKKKL
jgi:hypothetical protein